MKPVRLAIVGATGIVGRTTLNVLEEWRIPLESLHLFASGASAGQSISFRGEPVEVCELIDTPSDLDVVIMATSSTLSREWAPRFQDAGVLVIDHSSAFRMSRQVPLVIPEINGDALRNHHGLISNPNCSASVMLLPLAALNRAADLERVIASTYQSVSGSGQAALRELEAQTADESLPPEVYPKQIAFNVIPQIGEFSEQGVSGEEEKIADEIRKILDRPGLQVLSTTVRVPVRIGHAVSLSVELSEPLSLSEIETAFRGMPGMIYEPDQFRTPLDVAGKQEIFVSRLRRDSAHPAWLQFWVVGDNLRKGAASNAVQIMMELFS